MTGFDIRTLLALPTTGSSSSDPVSESKNECVLRLSRSTILPKSLRGDLGDLVDGVLILDSDGMYAGSVGLELVVSLSL